MCCLSQPTCGKSAAIAAARDGSLRFHPAKPHTQVYLNWLENIRPWVYRVAHNFGLNVRARSRFSRAFEPEMETTLTHGGNTPEQSVLEGERR